MMSDGVPGRRDAPWSVDPGEPVAAPGPVGPPGLAERVDGLILRLEVWRERPAVLTLLVLAGLGLCGAGWWLARPPDGVPVEDLLPLVDPAAEPATGGVGEQAAAEPLDRAEPGDGDGDGEPGDAAGPGDGEPGSAGGAPESQQLVVHVAGAVHRPGLVRLAGGSRIADAIARAGGPTRAADVHRLNLAAPLADGMRITVPEVGEESVEPLVVTAQPPPGAGAGAGASGGGDGGSSAPTGPVGPIDLNRASERELQALPGVGPATAAAIVAWRTEHGGFLTVDDLLSVPGIGPVKLAALSGLVTV